RSSRADTYCWRTRSPSFVSRLKRMVAELSVAEYSFTGIETRPKDSDREAIERAAISGPPCRRRETLPDQYTSRAGQTARPVSAPPDWRRRPLACTLAAAHRPILPVAAAAGAPVHPRRSASKTIRPAAARGGSGRSVGPFDRWRIGALLVLTLVALAGALNLENLRRLNHDLRGLAHAHEVIDALEGARLHLHEAEATQRGFLLMGDPQLLWRLRESVDAALGRLDHARTLTVAEPQLQEIGRAHV